MLCDVKEFSVIYECDRPIEDQPVIICQDCLFEHTGLHRLKDNILINVGKRCEKGADHATV